MPNKFAVVAYNNHMHSGRLVSRRNSFYIVSDKMAHETKIQKIAGFLNPGEIKQGWREPTTCLKTVFFMFKLPGCSCYCSPNHLLLNRN